MSHAPDLDFSQSRSTYIQSQQFPLNVSDNQALQGNIGFKLSNAIKKEYQKLSKHSPISELPNQRRCLFILFQQSYSQH